jgi:hypothetical protein
MTMKQEVICSWLGLVPADWPPNHYKLLGLEPGEENVACIEHHVQERMARLRCYQICNPEQATEAMNRLAQAFVCLTDPQAKRRYDASLGIKRPRPESVPLSARETVVGAAPVTQVVWKASDPPPPVRAAPESTAGEAENIANQASPVTIEAITPRPVDESSGVTPAPVSSKSSSGCASGPLATYKGFTPALLQMLISRRGLGTKRRLYQRIRKTRLLLAAWERAGKYLRRAKRPLKDAAEERELGRALAAIGKHLRGFPAFLGRPAQPGYRIAGRARLAPAVDWLHDLKVEERELLAQDWAAGRTLLASHRQFLRQEARAVRDLSPWRLALRAVAYDFPVEMTLLVIVTLVIGTVLLLALTS